MDRLLLRTDADEIIGMGHFVRCLSLAKEMGRFGFEPYFVTKYIIGSALSILDNNNIPYTVIPETASWHDEVHLLQQVFPFKQAVTILDFFHRNTLQRMKGFDDYTRGLKNISYMTGAFDTHLHDTLLQNTATDIDFSVLPYYGMKDHPILAKKGFTWITGPEYMIFQPEYGQMNANKRLIKKSASKILLTFGGSDPNHTTLLALEGLNLIEGRSLEIRLIIGPNFNVMLKEQIYSRIRKFKHQCFLVEAPSTIAYDMLWCDLALSNTGLTKYELALTGTPAIFLSNDEEHEEINKGFMKAGTGYDLGLYRRITPESLKDTIESLLDDSEARLVMSQKGMKLVDNRGAERLLRRVRELYDAQ